MTKLPATLSPARYMMSYSVTLEVNSSLLFRFMCISCLLCYCSRCNVLMFGPARAFVELPPSKHHISNIVKPVAFVVLAMMKILN